MATSISTPGFHDSAAAAVVTTTAATAPTAEFNYDFGNFFHPFVGNLIAKLNRDGLTGMLDPVWQASLKTPKDGDTNPADDYFDTLYQPESSTTVQVIHHAQEIDVSDSGAYSGYNWELLFFIPLTIALQLSKTQRFAEAQSWFHYIFNPTASDTSIPAPQRYWNFLAFRNAPTPSPIDALLTLLSTQPNSPQAKEVLTGYQAILADPFQPHAVARTRHSAYLHYVVMKYLDNLIAWGDYLFQQNTLETINEATLLYVLASNILGPRPQRIPSYGPVQPKTFAQLKSGSLDALGNALVELEGDFPFNLAPPASGGASNQAGPLLGIGNSLYFCIPANDRFLAYWDTVADRLYKVRHCMNIAGQAQQLPLFSPAIDPGLLVKAAASGIDVASAINGLNQPVGPMRSLTLIQKALEIAGEVRSMGNALLSALEKGDAEDLSLLRQRHEIQIQQMTQESRFLQWKSAQESTTSLLTSRATSLERLRYYQRLLGLSDDANLANPNALDRRELTEENFDDQYAALVGQYDKQLSLNALPPLAITGAASPSQQSGASGPGNLYLNTNENADLNVHGPQAHAERMTAMAIDTLFGPMALIPDMGIDLQFWGLGGHMVVFGGSMMTNFGRFLSSLANMRATHEEYSAARASKTAGYQRRADDWLLQYNLAAHEVMQNGRQILTSLIAEQIAHHDYLNVHQQALNAGQVNLFLGTKFTNQDLYSWMQAEISDLYYKYYQFAFETARRAEQTMKQELMRPELDVQTFVQFNYWDGGRKGLLSGEALQFDVKRLELAYHDNNKREIEMTRHVSIRQLDPMALIALKTTNSCQVTIPEWLYDRDCPGLYLRRIKSVALSIPCVAGPYTPVACTLSLLRSTVRTSQLLSNGQYLRQGANDPRFTDYAVPSQPIVTSAGSNDSGMFETNLRDDRFLPFEGSGAESVWQLDLPASYPGFDYSTISDVILHIRYTARQGVDGSAVTTALGQLFGATAGSNLALLFSLPQDFSTEWAAFVNSAATAAPFKAAIRRDYFPYFTNGRKITITGIDVYGDPASKTHPAGDVKAATAALADPNQLAFNLSLAEDSAGPTQVVVRSRGTQIYLVVRYTI
jgi:hypothetical protein